MSKGTVKRERLSVDVLPDEHRLIKTYAAMRGETIRDYVLDSVKERILKEKEKKELQVLSSDLAGDPVLENLWNNQKDSVYDEL